MKLAITTLLLWSLGALGATYSQTDSHTGTGFLKSFSHQAISDPTHGRVYVCVSALVLHFALLMEDHFLATTSIRTPPSRTTSPTLQATRSSFARITRRSSAPAVLDATRYGFKVTSNTTITSRCKLMSFKRRCAFTHA